MGLEWEKWISAGAVQQFMQLLTLSQNYKEKEKSVGWEGLEPAMLMSNHTLCGGAAATASACGRTIGSAAVPVCCVEINSKPDIKYRVLSPSHASSLQIVHAFWCTCMHPKNQNKTEARRPCSYVCSSGCVLKENYGWFCNSHDVNIHYAPEAKYSRHLIKLTPHAVVSLQNEDVHCLDACCVCLSNQWRYDGLCTCLRN